VTLVLVTGLLALVQVAVYLHIRNVAAAAAAEGARLAADADAAPEDGAARARSILVAAVGERTGGRFRCAAATEPGAGGAQLVVVRCTAALPVLLLPGTELLPVEVSGHALDEAW
jgi:hypothetical protein